MMRLGTFWSLQRLAWRQLFRWPRKQVLLDIDIGGPRHPSELCQCAGFPVDPNTAAHAVDHKPECPWLAAMCKACDGTGCCSTCRGDGCAPDAEIGEEP